MTLRLGTHIGLEERSTLEMIAWKIGRVRLDFLSLPAAHLKSGAIDK